MFSHISQDLTSETVPATQLPVKGADASCPLNCTRYTSLAQTKFTRVILIHSSFANLIHRLEFCGFMNINIYFYLESQSISTQSKRERERYST